MIKILAAHKNDCKMAVTFCTEQNRTEIVVVHISKICYNKIYQGDFVFIIF